VREEEGESRAGYRGRWGRPGGREEEKGRRRTLCWNNVAAVGGSSMTLLNES